jgi:uncharacterized protein (TIGR02118 family)
VTKIVALVYRKAGMSSKQFQSYWVEKHGPLMVRVVPGILHYTQNVPVETPGLPDDADGIAELWFEDMDALRDYLDWRSSKDALELRRDEDVFQDVGRTRRYIVEERVFKQQTTMTSLPG